MDTHNIGFYEDLTKIIIQLSSIITKYATYLFFCCIFQASFVNFPKTLLCGEVHPVTLNFTNTGSSPLRNLKVALSNPKFFTLGDHSDIPKFSGVYHIENAPSFNCSLCTPADKDFSKLSRVMDISIPGGTLHPNSTVTVLAWVRGNDIGGIHEVNFLFYYEPAQQMPKVRLVFQ